MKRKALFLFLLSHTVLFALIALSQYFVIIVLDNDLKSEFAVSTSPIMYNGGLINTKTNTCKDAGLTVCNGLWSCSEKICLVATAPKNKNNFVVFVPNQNISDVNCNATTEEESINRLDNATKKIYYEVQMYLNYATNTVFVFWGLLIAVFGVNFAIVYASVKVQNYLKLYIPMMMIPGCCFIILKAFFLITIYKNREFIHSQEQYTSDEPPKFLQIATEQASKYLEAVTYLEIFLFVLEFALFTIHMIHDEDGDRPNEATNLVNS